MAEAEGLRRAAARMRAQPSFLVGAAITLAFVAIALVALVWTPYPPDQIVVSRQLLPPSSAHPLGTDHFGRDMLSMLMAGSHSSVVVALVAVGLGMGLGIPLGLLAAARGGNLSEAVMRANDFVFAFPAILTAAMLAAVRGPGATTAAIAIGVFNVPVFARVTRGAALVVWRKDFILAARAAGRGGAAISLDHVLPNVASLVVVQATIQFALAILAEAGLSYVGLGTRPPTPSWGRLLSETQALIFLKPTLVLYPGLTIALAVLGLNLLGDGLRDILDPKLARQG